LNEVRSVPKVTLVGQRHMDRSETLLESLHKQSMVRRQDLGHADDGRRTETSAWLCLMIADVDVDSDVNSAEGAGVADGPHWSPDGRHSTCSGWGASWFGR
jgi:hypothetical protein